MAVFKMHLADRNSLLVTDRRKIVRQKKKEENTLTKRRQRDWPDKLIGQ